MTEQEIKDVENLTPAELLESYTPVRIVEMFKELDEENDRENKIFCTEVIRDGQQDIAERAEANGIVYHYDLDQNTDEWLMLKRGVISASNINVIVTPGGKPAKNESMRKYACKLAAQREFPHYIEDNYQSYDMMRGTLEEGTARQYYDSNYARVKECGFVTNSIFGIGCSPDGLVGNPGGIEIKCRQPQFQLETIVLGEVPVEYMNQIQTFLIVTGRDWCDFISYSNGMPLFVKRVFPDPERQATILTAVAAFEVEIENMRKEYREKSAGLVPTERVDFMQDGLIKGSE